MLPPPPRGGPHTACHTARIVTGAVRSYTPRANASPSRDGLELHLGHVAPELLELVEPACLGCEHVQDDVEVVREDPRPADVNRRGTAPARESGRRRGRGRARRAAPPPPRGPGSPATRRGWARARRTRPAPVGRPPRAPRRAARSDSRDASRRRRG